MKSGSPGERKLEGSHLRVDWRLRVYVHVAGVSYRMYFAGGVARIGPPDRDVFSTLGDDWSS